MAMTSPAPAPNPYLEPVPTGLSQTDALQAAIASNSAQGWRLESAFGGMATMVAGQPVNHILHLLLTVFTLGLWAPIWFIITITSDGESRINIIADTEGNIRYQRGR